MKLQGLEVLDATQPLEITITTADIKNGKKKNAHSCAAAQALCREQKCEQAVVHFSRAYVKKEDHWLRYRVSNAMRSEVVAFDRGGEFAPGDYILQALQPSNRKGERLKRNRGNGKKNPNSSNKPKLPYHVTTGVRNRMEFDK